MVANKIIGEGFEFQCFNDVDKVKRASYAVARVDSENRLEKRVIWPPSIALNRSWIK